LTFRPSPILRGSTNTENSISSSALRTSWTLPIMFKTVYNLIYSLWWSNLKHWTGRKIWPYSNFELEKNSYFLTWKKIAGGSNRQLTAVTNKKQISNLIEQKRRKYVMHNIFTLIHLAQTMDQEPLQMFYVGLGESDAKKKERNRYKINLCVKIELLCQIGLLCYPRCSLFYQFLQQVSYERMVFA